MLTKPDSRILAAFARLVRTPDGVEFTSYLKRELDTTKDRLIEASDRELYLRLQGRGRLLRELIEELETAPEKINKPK